MSRFGLAYNNFNSALRDEYTTPKDRIWGDVIKQERVMELVWKKTWEKTIVPKHLRPDNYNKPKKELSPEVSSFYHPKKPSDIPPKASSMIGWRSADRENSMDYFGVKYVSNKRRFMKEQTGYYRALKYIDEAKKTKDEHNSPTTTAAPDEKYIRHTIKRLIC